MEVRGISTRGSVRTGKYYGCVVVEREIKRRTGDGVISDVFCRDVAVAVTQEPGHGPDAVDYQGFLEYLRMVSGEIFCICLRMDRDMLNIVMVGTSYCPAERGGPDVLVEPEESNYMVVQLCRPKFAGIDMTSVAVLIGCLPFRLGIL